MSNFSLYNRFTSQGTLTDPEEVPDPLFALPSTVNWMRALALLVHGRRLDHSSALAFYTSVQQRTSTLQQENTVFEQLLFAAHQLSALSALKMASSNADVARVGIVAWYYGIYSAASAMVAAQDGSFQDDHTGTATTWDRQFVASNKVMEPFTFRVSSLVKEIYTSEVNALRDGNNFVLNEKPNDAFEASGACCAYLSGSAKWWAWKTEQSLRKSRDFKELNVSNFRTKAARSLRDSRLTGKSVSFLHQAFRYRGKANYREALYLGYGNMTNTRLEGFIDDLEIVLQGFLAMAGAFVSKRIGQPLWCEFLNDLDKNRSFTLSPKAVWS